MFYVFVDDGVKFQLEDFKIECKGYIPYFKQKEKSLTQMHLLKVA